MCYEVVVHSTRGNMVCEMEKLEDWEKFFDESYVRGVVEKLKAGRKDEWERASLEHFFEPGDVFGISIRKCREERLHPEQIEKTFGIKVKGKLPARVLKDGKFFFIYEDGVDIYVENYLEKEKEFEKFWLKVSM